MQQDWERGVVIKECLGDLNSMFSGHPWLPTSFPVLYTVDAWRLRAAII